MIIDLQGKSNRLPPEEAEVDGAPPSEERRELVIQPDFLQVRSALAELRSFCAARGLPLELWQSLEIAVAEALNNAVEHGCGGLPAEQAAVILRWRWQGEWLEIEVIDPGHFQPNPQEGGGDSVPDSLAERGRGAFLMRQMVDHVIHELCLEGHATRLRKNVGLALFLPPPVASASPLFPSVLDAMSEELANCYENLNALFYFAERLATAEAFQQFIDEALRRLRTLVEGDDAYLRLVGGEGLDLHDGGEAPPWAPRRIPAAFGCVEWRVVRTNSEATLDDCGALDPADPLHRPGWIAFCTPIFFRQEVIGLLCVARRRGGDYFTAGQLGLMRVVAEFLGIAHRNALLQRQRELQLRAARELEIASEIQRSLLPRHFPAHARYEIFGCSESALEVGGDYFNAIELSDGAVLFVIADVMGKGLPAALLATIFRTAVHARLDFAARPAELLHQVNRQLFAELSALDIFITAQLAWLSPDGLRLELASAGHCPALRLNRAEGRIEPLWSEGLPLGILRDPLIDSRTFTLGADDSLVFMTDGIYEVADSRHRLLDFEGIMHYLFLHGPAEPRRLCRDLLEFIRLYAGNGPAADDQTLLIAAPRRPAPAA